MTLSGPGSTKQEPDVYMYTPKQHQKCLARPLRLNVPVPCSPMTRDTSLSERVVGKPNSNVWQDCKAGNNFPCITSLGALLAYLSSLFFSKIFQYNTSIQTKIKFCKVICCRLHELQLYTLSHAWLERSLLTILDFPFTILSRNICGNIWKH